MLATLTIPCWMSKHSRPVRISRSARCVPCAVRNPPIKEDIIMNTHIHKGAFLTKEAPADKIAADQALTVLHKELGDIVGALEINKKATDDHFTELTTHYKGIKADS